MSRDPRKDRARKRRLRRREDARGRKVRMQQPTESTPSSSCRFTLADFTRAIQEMRFTLAEFTLAIQAMRDTPSLPSAHHIMGYGVLQIGGIDRRGYMTGDMRFWETDAVPARPYRELATPIAMGAARERFHWLPSD